MKLRKEAVYFEQWFPPFLKLAIFLFLEIGLFLKAPKKRNVYNLEKKKLVFDGHKI